MKDEDWLRDALVSVEDMADNEIHTLLEALANQRIKTTQNVLDASEGTWSKVAGPELFKDLVKKKAYQLHSMFVCLTSHHPPSFAPFIYHNPP